MKNIFKKIFIVVISALTYSLSYGNDNFMTVSATGTGVVERKPSHIHIILGVDVNADSVNNASNMLSSRSSKVVEHLKTVKSVSQINTSNMRIFTNYKNYEKKEIKEYSASLTINFDVDIQSAPKLIEKCLLLGANRINGYDFKVSAQEMREMQNEAISLATENAISQIRTSLNAANLTFDSIKQIQVTPSLRHHRYEASSPMMLKSSIADGAVAPIESSGLSVQREVQVVAGYK